MGAIWPWMQEHAGLVFAVAAVSAAVFLISIFATPMLIARLPADYFAHATRPPGPLDRLRPALRWTLMIGKNLLGGVLMLAGLAMLVLPGQGLLTLLSGLLLIDLPGKYRLERWLVARRPIRRSLNWLRRRLGRDELILPTSPPPANRNQRINAS